jgi:hypothetical protein
VAWTPADASRRVQGVLEQNEASIPTRRNVAGRVTKVGVDASEPCLVEEAVETGRAGGRMVLALIVGQGDKDLVEVTVDTDGDTGTVTATDGHPFWLKTRARGSTRKTYDLGTCSAPQQEPGSRLERYARGSRACQLFCVRSGRRYRFVS